MTCNTWHVTCDTSHMTHDMWHVTIASTSSGCQATSLLLAQKPAVSPIWWQRSSIQATPALRLERDSWTLSSPWTLFLLVGRSEASLPGQLIYPLGGHDQGWAVTSQKPPVWLGPSSSQTGIARHKPGGDRHQKLTEQNTQTGQLGTSQVDRYISRLRIKIKYCAICPHSYLNDIDLKRHKWFHINWMLCDCIQCG